MIIYGLLESQKQGDMRHFHTTYETLSLVKSISKKYIRYGNILDVISYEYVPLFKHLGIDQQQSNNNLIMRNGSNNSRKGFTQSKIRARWSFRFQLKCSDRTFNLYSASEDEHALWMYTFHWIVNENRKLLESIDLKSTLSKSNQELFTLPQKVREEILEKCEIAKKLKKLANDCKA